MRYYGLIFKQYSASLNPSGNFKKNALILVHLPGLSKILDSHSNTYQIIIHINFIKNRYYGVVLECIIKMCIY